MREVRVDRLCWPEVEAYLGKDDRAILTIGAVEQHGPHLVMGTDSMTAEAVARDAGLRAGVLVYPPIWYGWSESHMAFPGTTSIRAETMQAIIEDLIESLSAHGFKRFIVLNGNRRANLPPLQVAASNLTRAGGRVVFVADVAYLSFDEGAALRRSEPGGIGHAGEMETSHMMHIHPDCVWPDRAIKHLGVGNSPKPTFLASDPAYDGDSRYHHTRHPQQFRQAHPEGVAGDPTVASEDTGAKLHSLMVTGLVNLLDTLAAASLPPMTEK
jgi:creatinine amidohydrolase